MKAQVGIEYLMVYVSSAAILIYVIASGLLTNFVGGSHAATAMAPVQSSCYISAELDCIGASANSATGNVVLVFVNNAGVSLKIPPNSFGARLRYSLKDLVGSCTPAVAAPNSKVTCSVNAGSGSFSGGQELMPTFSVGYQACAHGSCQPQVSVGGSATIYSS